MTDSTTYTCKHGSTPILSARNYHSWKNNITNLLAMDDSLEIVHGTELASTGNATAQARDFRKRSQRAFGMIWSSTEPSIRTCSWCKPRRSQSFYLVVFRKKNFLDVNAERFCMCSMWIL